MHKGIILVITLIIITDLSVSDFLENNSLTDYDRVIK
jgi:hypothetical protein